MPNDAADTYVGPDQASESLIALVAKREQELKGATPPTPSAVTPEAKAGDDGASQAEEGEGKEPKAETPPAQAGKEAKPKGPDVEWASDALKRRLSALYEAKQLDDAGLAELKKDFLLSRGAYKKMEEAAEIRKKAEAERDTYKERAERYDRLMADPKFHAALGRAEAGTSEEDDILAAETPEKRKEIMRREARGEIDATLRSIREAEQQKQARIEQIQGWADSHRESMNGTVSPEDYEAALKESIDGYLQEGVNPLLALTEKGLIRRVNERLEFQRVSRQLKSHEERSEESKREAARSAQASSPPGVRTQMPRQYDMSKRADRIAKTLAETPIRPD